MYFRVSECKSTGNNRHISHFESLRFGQNPMITKKNEPTPDSDTPKSQKQIRRRPLNRCDLRQINVGYYSKKDEGWNTTYCSITYKSLLILLEITTDCEYHILPTASSIFEAISKVCSLSISLSRFALDFKWSDIFFKDSLSFFISVDIVPFIPAPLR